jgi:hypothetical protein
VHEESRGPTAIVRSQQRDQAPRGIHLSAEGSDAAGGWLATLLNIAVQESGAPGTWRQRRLPRVNSAKGRAPSA